MWSRDGYFSSHFQTVSIFIVIAKQVNPSNSTMQKLHKSSTFQVRQFPLLLSTPDVSNEERCTVHRGSLPEKLTFWGFQLILCSSWKVYTSTTWKCYHLLLPYISYSTFMPFSPVPKAHVDTLNFTVQMQDFYFWDAFLFSSCSLFPLLPQTWRQALRFIQKSKSNAILVKKHLRWQNTLSIKIY